MAPTSEVVTARPAPALATFIDHYLGYRMTGYPPGLHRGLPSHHLTFIVAIGPAIDVIEQTDPNQRPDAYRCVLSGLQASSASIAHSGDQEGVTIALTPMGCRTLFGLPAGELWNTSLECANVAGPAGDELWERLQGPAPWSRRFAVCDEILGRLANPDRLVTPELSLAWRSLVDSGGAASIGPLAERIGWSRQHLTRRFNAEFGVSPKLAGRITRFERARRMIERTPSHITLAQVAAACGYYDQAHLNRDFADLAGCSPTLWLAQEVTSVQDAPGSAD
ncbi:helix-turn-helix domain-containing protein [Nocardia bovistercoris]|uniref:AraC family transcriptional regulator n=1 Tax=Nocardia bovistercoris TaxID=2785916 RepID=A0A931MZB7_9NOCA|nr:helix-turn-helix domain-containing protein [Nocardia bovistercoris]MBH0775970.1 AraC family transcriptional regulator [Nocardia bovistercoris]